MRNIDNTKSVKMQYREIPPERPFREDDGPLVTVGWIVFRDVLCQLGEALQFFLLWQNLLQVLVRIPGMEGYRYLFRLWPLSIGISIHWKDRASEMHFYRNEAHHRIAAFALKSRLTPALQLEHFWAGDPNRVSGFYYFEQESDLPRAR